MISVSQCELWVYARIKIGRGSVNTVLINLLSESKWQKVFPIILNGQLK